MKNLFAKLTFSLLIALLACSIGVSAHATGSITGIVQYGGPETGTIHVAALSDPEGTNMAGYTVLDSGPGPFTIDSLPAGDSNSAKPNRTTAILITLLIAGLFIYAAARQEPQREKNDIRAEATCNG